MANDLNSLVPASSTTAFPRLDSGVPAATPYTVVTTLASLALAEFTGVTGHTASQPLRDSCAANYVAGVLQNGAELTALAGQLTKDVFRWRLARLDTKFAGICPYAPEGMSLIDWTWHEGEVATRVQCGPLDRTLDFYHLGTYGSATSCCGEVTVTTTSNVQTSYITNLTVPGTLTFSSTIATNAGVENFTSTYVGTYQTGSTTTYQTGTTATYQNNSVISNSSTETYTLDYAAVYESGSQVTFNSGALLTSAASWSITAGTWTFGPSSTVVFQGPVTVGTFNVSIATVTWTTQQDNYAIPAGTTWLRANVTSAMTLTGIVAPTGAELVWITNVGTQDLTIANQSSSSTAGNRVQTDTNADEKLSPNQTGLFLYDTVSAEWRYQGPGSGSTTLTVGTTAIASGTTGLFLYQNGTVLGEKALASTDLPTSALVWTKVGTKTFTDLATAATTNTINVGTVPAGTVAVAWKIKHSVQFSGGTITTYNATGIGLSGGTTTHFASFSLNMATAVTATNGLTGNCLSTTGQIIDSHTGTITVTLTVNTGAVNTNQATAGTVEVWLLVGVAT